MPGSTPRSAGSSGPTGNGYQSGSRRSASTPSIRAWLATRSNLTYWVGSKAVRQKPAPNASSRNSTGSSNRGSTIMSARHGPSESSLELGTLKLDRQCGKLGNPMSSHSCASHDIVLPKASIVGIVAVRTPGTDRPRTETWSAAGSSGGVSRLSVRFHQVHRDNVTSQATGAGGCITALSSTLRSPTRMIRW